MSTSIEAGARTTPLFLLRAGQWFLRSGIQETHGGVARYHHIADNRNARISTEITGYTISALMELHERTADDAYLEAATAGADLLCGAWDTSASAMPFEWSATGELPEHHSYFFDNGIIIRGLLRVWNATGRQRYLDIAVQCADSMRRDFVNTTDIHPILALPTKTPLARDSRWSRSSDCYQLKSALGWLSVAEATGDTSYVAEYERALERALQTHERFFDHEPDPQRVMDRLHAYGYFLEAILPRAGRPEVRQALSEGITRAAGHLRRVRGGFERSDVNGQILRVRLWADGLGAVPLDSTSAEEEAAWAGAYQMECADARLDGGFNFGQRGGAPTDYSNPVSTAFCLQGLALWDDRSRGIPALDWRKLI